MKRLNTKSLTLIAIMTAITCILGPLSIAIPMSPVPISFTNLALYFTIIILGWKKGTISCLIYLLIGLIGIPVFSGFTSGPGKLFGPTGGYLISFILMVLVGGYFVDRFPGKVHMYVLGLVLGTLIIYALGSVWLAYQANLTFKASLIAGVLLYIPGDIAKIVIATINGPIIKKAIQKAGYLAD